VTDPNRTFEGTIKMVNTIISALGNVFAPVVKYFEVARTERALASLSDELLRDIGIERAQVAEIARSAASRDIPKEKPLGATLVVLHGKKSADRDQHDLPSAA
jgi:uncharacterized protein YjiS (DUF1127 family)